MPKKSTVAKAKKAKQEGKAPTTQASEFVHEEMEKLKEKGPKKAPKSRKQAIAIGLDMARRSGVALPPKAAVTKKTAKKTAKKPAPKKKKTTKVKPKGKGATRRAAKK